MRSVVRNVVVAAAAILLFGSATAQATESIVLRANVPFPFVVKGHVFPAGKYVIQRDDLMPGLLEIRNEANNHQVAYFETIRDAGRDRAGSHAGLTFKRHENEYRLASVWETPSQGWDIMGRR